MAAGAPWEGEQMAAGYYPLAGHCTLGEDRAPVVLDHPRNLSASRIRDSSASRFDAFGDVISHLDRQAFERQGHELGSGEHQQPKLWKTPDLADDAPGHRRAAEIGRYCELIAVDR
jgi:hypothetical protein